MLKSILARRVSRKGLTLALAGMLIASAACCSGQTAGTGLSRVWSLTHPAQLSLTPPL